MKTRSSSKSSTAAGISKGMCCPVGEAKEKYRDYNPLSIKGKGHEQFAPTPAQPVRQHARLAGC